MNNWQSIITRLGEITGNPVALIALLVALLTVGLGLVGRQSRWWIVGLALATSTFGPAIWNDQWMAPGGVFSPIVRFARPVTLVLIGLIGTFALLTRKNEFYRPSLAAMMFLLFQVVWCARFMPTEYFRESLTRLATFLMLFVVFAIFIPTWIREFKDGLYAIRAVAIAGAIAIVLNVAAFLIFRTNTSLHGRLFGLTGNANHLGTMVGLVFPAFLGLAMYKSEIKWVRLLMACLMGLGAVLIVFSGSRGGFGMCLVVIISMFRIKLGRILIFLVPLAFVTFVILNMFELSESSADRLTSTTNTRSGEWQFMFELWKESPVFGSTAMGMAPKPGSYVSALAMTGVLGVIMVAIFLIASFKFCVELLGASRRLGEHAIVADVALAGYLGILAIATFEGTLYSTLSPGIFFTYGYLMIGQAAILWSRTVNAVPSSPTALQSAGH